MNRDFIWPKLQEVGVQGTYDDFNKARQLVLAESEQDYIAAPIKPYSEVTPFLKYLVDKMGFTDLSVDQIREIAIEGWEFGSTRITCYSGTRAALRWIQNRGLKLAVVSNWYQEMIEGFLEQLEIRTYFDTVVTSEKAGALKSDLTPFQIAIDKLDVNPSTVVHVGDSIRQDGACRRLGIKYIYSTWHLAEHPEEATPNVSTEQYDYTATSFPELIELIDTLLR